ncbi:MAG TPA: GNAT family N-acetyltransferase [Pseudonocardiaceae bacterium]|jgi:GNAT superfamily N-acetyltransferase|nr:GNAT family N-acetyltransferase [Pseudonocardiaceae bacterium]
MNPDIDNGGPDIDPDADPSADDGPSDAADPAVLAAIAAFEDTLAQRMATTVLPTAGGYAVLNARYPHSYAHNRLQVNEPASAAALLADADRVLGGAGLAYRQVSVADARLAAILAPEFLAAGYARYGEVLMVLGTPVAHQPDHRVRRLPYRPLVRDAVARGWRESLPDAAEEVAEQLADRTELVESACAVTHHVVLIDGAVVSRCELYRAGGIAQIENVVTDQPQQGQGLARAIVLDAIDTAGTVDSADSADSVPRNEIVFLRADAEDWPRHFYRRLGFRNWAASTVFERTG